MNLFHIFATLLQILEPSLAGMPVESAPVASLASTLGTLVGSTSDACDKRHTVYLDSTSVKAGESKVIRLGYYTKEKHFRCGGTRERFANDVPFNSVRMTRAGNGAIFTEFLVL